MKQLLKQSKERELNLKMVEEIGYEVVEKAFQDKLATARQEERSIEGSYLFLPVINRTYTKILTNLVVAFIR